MANIHEKVQSIRATVKMPRLLRDHDIYAHDAAETQILAFCHSEERRSARCYPKDNRVWCFRCVRMFDVIGAYMALHTVDFTTAVESLVVKYNVPIKEQPHRIQQFYAQAARYTHGDPKKIKLLIIQLGRDFKDYYEGIIGIRNFENVIDYLWEQYDLLYQMELSPKELEKAAHVWYKEATQLIASYKQIGLDIEEFKERGIVEEEAKL